LGNIFEKKCAQNIWARYFSKENAPNAKNIAQMAKFRPIWSHCSAEDN
jgi:hypothetical protein